MVSEKRLHTHLQGTLPSGKICWCYGTFSLTFPSLLFRRSFCGTNSFILLLHLMLMRYMDETPSSLNNILLSSCQTAWKVKFQGFTWDDDTEKWMTEEKFNNDENCINISFVMVFSCANKTFAEYCAFFSTLCTISHALFHSLLLYKYIAHAKSFHSFTQNNI